MHYYKYVIQFVNHKFDSIYSRSFDLDTLHCYTWSLISQDIFHCTKEIDQFDLPIQLPRYIYYQRNRHIHNYHSLIHHYPTPIRIYYLYHFFPKINHYNINSIIYRVSLNTFHVSNKEIFILVIKTIYFSCVISITF